MPSFANVKAHDIMGKDKPLMIIKACSKSAAAKHPMRPGVRREVIYFGPAEA